MKIPFLAIIAIIPALTAIFAQEPPSSRVPSWAAEAVWYQIFPERFWNGDRGNDPAPADLAGSWPFFTPEDWQIHPWTSDWYALQLWEKSVEWSRVLDWAKPGEPNFSACAGMRRYGGDLQGVIDRLDYLQELGITAVYFNPLFESPSLHKYDAEMFHHVDNNFGPDPGGDRRLWENENPADPAAWHWTAADLLFLDLIRECHQRGIKIIIDGVFNHSGNTFWAFRDLLKNQQKSPYKDWYVVKQWDDPATPENELDYQCWNGIHTLPEFRQDENGLVSGPREHVFAIVKRWMDPDGDGDPADGIDGWRLDVAEKVHINFWKEFRRRVKEINPEAYISGEVWWEDWRQYRMFNAAPWFAGAFDAVMNYRFARALQQFAINREQQISALAFADSLQAIYRDYPWQNVLACQNLMDSHDVDRLASQIVNPDRWYDHGANPLQNPAYDIRKPTDAERRRQRLIIGLQMALPGAPMLYYGDEAGMWGADDPDCRKPMLWPELQYAAEVSHPLGKPRPADSVAFDRQLFEWYKKLIALRRQNRELALGGIEFLQTGGAAGGVTGKAADKVGSEGKPAPKTLVFRRDWEGQTCVVAVNSGEEAASIELNPGGNIAPGAVLTDLLNNAAQPLPAAKVPVALEPFEIKIFKVTLSSRRQ